VRLPDGTVVRIVPAAEVAASAGGDGHHLRLPPPHVMYGSGPATPLQEADRWAADHAAAAASMRTAIVHWRQRQESLSSALLPRPPAHLVHLGDPAGGSSGASIGPAMHER